MSDEEEFAPEIAKNPKSCHVEEGNSAAFSCKIIASPAAKVWWQKDGDNLEPGERFKVALDIHINFIISVCTNYFL